MTAIPTEDSGSPVAPGSDDIADETLEPDFLDPDLGDPEDDAEGAVAGEDHGEEGAAEDHDADHDDRAEDDEPDGVEPADPAVVLVHPPHTVDEADGHVYDLSEWPRDLLEELDALVIVRGVERVWQGPELVVRSMDVPDVDECIDQMILDHSGARPLRGARVLYEVASWPAGFRASLVESLAVAGVRFEWNPEGNLVVLAEDEAEVDAIFEAMPDPEEIEDGANGLEVQGLLSQLYAALDVLYKNPDSTSARSELAEVTDRLEWVAVPFGFDARDWDSIVSQAAVLRSVIDTEATSEGAQPADPMPEDEFVDHCRSLRAQLITVV